jgi:ABC-type lipoprotein export system ATPase subunit
LASWLERSDQADRSAAQVATLKAAEGWLQDEIEELRNERFGPIAEKARAVFEMMRHDSNVQLESVELEGAGTRRRVRLKVTVDGVDGAALGVMSQGELNALALSLFLPRATLDESPFRFVVIDDPVQAMDPNRVDGLARALEEAAKTRQVIVFTHDERLPASARRLGVPATVIEVQRRENSVVEATVTDEPVKRYLDDANALALTQELPEAVKAKVIPNFLRLALEASCHEVVWKRRLLKGASHTELESLLDSKRTKQLMALALFDDDGRAGDVMGKLNGWDRRLADAYREINEGSHGAAIGGYGQLVASTRALVKRVREQT